ncbi:hypothetical protein Poli38472_002437 [Pythium oligandrum]|uniref:Cyclin-like domain-containing protein n=1 Tax=Pythium oligandrum TaxID=41045 RepID=A0A8K1FI68_PYTOL|nr:hypothetical protein Poli38472_002437 [Pythium oligandrum]|eukprot:TMW63496.1 hypothetical protein Poli38472_002437 [Pythium oligandrum]
MVEDVHGAMTSLPRVQDSKPIDAKEENLLRQVERSLFIRKCAQSLLLDATTTATAVVLTQQFFAHGSKPEWDDRVIAGACVFLATKSCEVPRTLRSVVNVVHAVKNDTTEPLGADQEYSDLKNSLINAEQTVLRALQFDVDVVLPFAYLLNYAHQGRFKQATAHCALALANDILCAEEALLFPAFVLAACCLYTASQMLEDDGEFGKDKWWYQYDTSDEDITAVSNLLACVYAVMKQHPNSALTNQVGLTPTESNTVNTS